MFGLTATQLALLQAPDQEVKAAISIGIASPLRYCTGADAVQIDSNWYTPRSMSFDEIKIDSPTTASCSVVIDDLEGDIRTAWYAERFSGVNVSFFILIRQEGGAWLEVVELAWYCTTCAYNKRGQFRLNVEGGAGLRPRGGLMTGNRTDFSFAPEPGEAMRFGNSGITFHGGNPNPPPAPGGYNGPHQFTQPGVGSASDGEASRLLAGTITQALEKTNPNTGTVAS